MRRHFVMVILIIFTATQAYTESDAINGINVDSSSYDASYSEEKYAEREYCLQDEGLESQHCLREGFLSIKTSRTSDEISYKNGKKPPTTKWLKPSTPRECGKLGSPFYPPNNNKGILEWEKHYEAEMDNFDLREKYKTICPSIAEISDQGGCDSCWAVAAADTMTDRLCIRSNGTITRRFSTADLISCCHYCRIPTKDKEKGDLCTRGGFQRKAWLYWKNAGIVSGHYNKNDTNGCINYKVPPCTHISKKTKLSEGSVTNRTKCSDPIMECPTPDAKDVPKCLEKCDESSKIHSYQEDRMRGEECYFMERKFDGKELNIKLEILFNGPVHAFMTVYESFYTMFSKSSGIHEGVPYLGPQYNEDENDACKGHSIRIVGWGKNKETNKSYWIAANSWGENWGIMNGFFHLDFDHDKGSHIGKEEFYAGIPKLPE